MKTLLLDNATTLEGAKARSNRSLTIRQGKIASIQKSGAPPPKGAERIDLGGNRLLPGFVDIQVNGGGGVLFNESPTVGALRTISDAHVQFGTTTLLPTLISDDYAVIRRAMGAVCEAIEEGVPGIIGIHVEGPFLNPERKGAHDESKFRTLDDEAIEILTSLGSLAVTMVTLAPERNEREFVQALAQSGVIVFAGHTAATYDDCKRAEAVGISGYTHLFNAMTPFGSREPGVVGAALEGESTCFGIIADGHHVHPTSFKLAVSAKYRGGAVLVTDAMPTVGSLQPFFELGGERIEVCDGVLRNAAGSLAGSHLSMIDAVRNTTQFTGLPFEEAVRMASVYPATAIRQENDIGSIVEGRFADLVELNRKTEVVRVWRRGRLDYCAA